jgi:hypothetical protein
MISLAFWLPSFVCAQDEGREVIPLDHFYVKRTGGSFFRRILKDVTFGLSTGYGNTFFSHKIDGFGVYQLPGANPQIFAGSTATRYGNWVNDAFLDKSGTSGSAVVIPASGDLGFKGNALNIPLQAFVFYNFLQRYRIGGGYSYELMSIGSMHPTSKADQISDFQPPDATGFVRKYYGMAGVSFYRLGEYLFTGDLQVGNWKPKGNFNSAITGGTYYNLGITIERDFSEYFKVFARPSFEFKSYSFPIPESSITIDHSVNAFYVNVGVTYRIPELRRCFLKDCHAQINHAHGNKEYRSRKHAIFKKQNPGYGENDKELIKYKGKNKKKLNPY